MLILISSRKPIWSLTPVKPSSYLSLGRILNPVSQHFSPPALQLEDSVYSEPSDEFRNLCDVMDHKLIFRSHANSICMSCFFQLKRLRSIRSFVPKPQFVTLVHVFINSRLDFCNSIFISLPDSLVNRTQTVQNYLSLVHNWC